MKYVSYLRVSTQKQGNSGLGLDSQRDIIRSYIARMVGAELISEHIEVETGTAKKERVIIHQALAECKRTGAILIVAKLDRLARDVRFVLSVLDSGAEIVFCDFPSGNRLMITIISAIAEYEARLISERTKAALNEKKKVMKLGNPNIGLAQQAGTRAAAKARTGAMTPNRKNMSTIRMLRSSGHTLQEIADTLNSSGELTSTGCNFTSGSIHNILTREKKNEEATA